VKDRGIEMFKKKVMITISGILVLIIGSIASANASAVEVRMEKVREGSFKEYVEVRGIVDLSIRENIICEIPGIINELKFEEGDIVKKGDILAKLDVKNAELALRKAEAEYNAGLATLRDMRNSVKPEHIKQAEAELKQTQILLDEAKKNYEFSQKKLNKMKMLYDEGALSEQDYKSLENSLHTALNNVREMEQKKNIAQYSFELKKEGTSEDLIRAEEERIKQFSIQIEELKRNYDKTSIHSTISGVVLEKHVKNGSAVEVGLPVYEVGEYESSFIKALVLTDDAGKIREGQKVEISGDVLGNDVVNGQVYYIAPKAETIVSSLGTQQQQILVKIKFENKNLQLKMGYGIDLKIITNEKSSTLYIPDKAVFEIEGKERIFVNEKGRLKVISVKTGMENEDYIEIVKGLKSGDMVISEPNNDLKEGMRVKIKK
jgi:HlyD family secretion protein